MKRKAQLLAIVLLAGLSLVALGVLPQPGAARQPSPEQVVRRAWRNAQESGVYRFSTELVQTTHPAPKLANAGRTSRVDSLYIEGETDLPSRTLRMALWQSGSLLDARDGVEIRVEGERSYGRAAGSQTWEELDGASISGAFAPDNDLLAYLAGAKNIQVSGNRESGIGESDALDSPMPDSLTQYAFDLDGPAFAAYMRDQLEDHLRKQGELPAGLHLDISDIYRGMAGGGELWVDGDGLPLRLTIEAEFPQQSNGQRVEVALKADFSHFDRGFLQARAEPQTPGQALVRGYHNAARTLGLPRSAAEWQTLAQQSLVVLAFLGMGGLLLLQAGRRKPAHAVLAALLVVSMVVPPLVQAQQITGFSQRLAARRAETEQAQAEADLQQELEAELAASNWEPNQDPLGNQEIGDQVASFAVAQLAAPETRSLIPGTQSPIPNIRAPLSNIQSSPSDPCANASADTDPDGDGLTDKQECRLGTDPNKADTDADGLKDGAERRLGTNPLNADTDEDGLTDGAEVTAFTVGGKPWYTDPTSPDSNNDGLLDSEECRDRLRPVDAQSRPTGLSPTTTCQDSDGDGTPDVFDADNDGDGVPDRGDVSPYKALDETFTLTNPFKFSASGLHTDQPRPLLVDFQLRPANPEHLAFALNVLDWPTGDSKGNVQETHGKTFADFMTAAQAEADPSAANGDMRLVPMLEILMGGQDVPLPLTQARAEYDWAYGLGDGFQGTVTLEKSGASGSQFVFAFSGDAPDEVRLFQGSCGAQGASLGEVQDVGASWVRSERVTALANGQHALIAWKGNKSACLPLADIPNGNDPERMVDTQTLQAYGISVRDIDTQGNLAAYVPLYLVPDESGGGRVAFQGRMMYQPQATTWSDHHQINLVWTLQMLQADGRTTIAHSYYDEWQLTGLAAREDYGLQVAVAWEDPNNDDNKAVDDRLWHLARGLQAAFLTGRDADGNGQRDLDVAGIRSRFDGFGGSDEQRWNIPRYALGVKTFSYPSEDHLAKIMMEETPYILRIYFNGQGVESPTLLFAQEAAARSVNLDVSDHTDWSNGALRVEFGGETPPSLLTTASLSWAPFRQDNGTWESYPFEEYWDRMHVQFGDLFVPDQDTELARDIAAGSAEIAAGYYLALYQGLANLAGVNDRPGTEFVAVDPPDDEKLASAWNSAIGVKGGVLGDVVGNIAEGGFEALENIAARRATDFALLFEPEMVSANKFKAFVGKGVKGTLVGNWKAFGKNMNLRKHGATGKGVSSGVAIAGALAAVGLSIWASTKAGDKLGKGVAVLNGVNLVMQIKNTLNIAQSIIKDGLQSVRTVESAARKAGAVGVIIGAVLAFAGFAVQMIISKTAAFSMDFNDALASAIATAVVGAIMLAITLIPIVGQIVAAIVALIDATIALICGLLSKEAQEGKAGKRICKGVSGLLGEVVKLGIYNRRNLVGNMASEGRLQFLDFQVALTQPELGFIQGNQLKTSLDVRNTIMLSPFLRSDGPDWSGYAKDAVIPVPFDPLAVPYLWMFNNDNLKSARFQYKLRQVLPEEKKDFHHNLKREGDNWQPATKDSANSGFFRDGHTFYLLASNTVVASDLDETLDLGKTGVNVALPLYLSEGAAIPWQECIGIPTPIFVLPIIPVCYIRSDKKIQHLPLDKSLTYDVFPPTLDGFRALAAKDGGYALAWDAQFPRLNDADGDGLATSADPNDSKWDTDGDGLNDRFEIGQGSDPQKADTDGDGLNDAQEARLGTQATAADSDGDGLNDKEELDGWEIVYEFVPNCTADCQKRTWVSSDPLDMDADGDGLTDVQEKIYGFSPNAVDDGSILSYESQVIERDAPHLLLRFEATAGAQNFGDSSGYGNAAVCADYCPTAGVSGRYGNALDFAGYKHVRVPNHASLNPDGITIGLWAKSNSSFDPMNETLVKKGTAYETAYEMVRENRKIRFSIEGWYHSAEFTAPAGFDYAVWHHYAGTFDGATIKIYIDGELAGSAAYSGRINAADGSDLWLGGPFEGRLDEVILFDRALDGAEIQDLVMAARYNPMDLVVQMDQPLIHHAVVQNNLLGNYAHGLLQTKSDDFARDGAGVRSFLLNPTERQTYDEAFSLRYKFGGGEGPGRVNLVASAEIKDWRAQSGYAELWLPFNEGRGASTFKDMGGVQPARNGACYGGGCPTAGQAGMSGPAARFDGSNDEVQVTGVDVSDRSFSVAFWAKRSALSGEHWVIGQGWNLSNQGLRVGFVAANKLRCDFTNNSLDATVPADGDWHSYVCAYDQNNRTRTIYVDGKQAAQDTPPSGYQGSGTFTIGRSFAGGGYFQGDLDEVRVFARTLSQQEASELANIPILYYSFDDETGWSDPSGAAGPRDSAAGIGTTCGLWTCPDQTAGVSGQGAVFNGREYARMTQPLDLTSGRFSLSIWLFPTDPNYGWQAILGDEDDLRHPVLEMLGGKLRFAVGNADRNQWDTTGDILTANKWNHVVITYDKDASTTTRIYVNGVQKGTFVGYQGHQPPGASTFSLGRTNKQGSVYVNRVTVIDEGDGPGDAELSVFWNRLCLKTQGNLKDGDWFGPIGTFTFGDASSFIDVWEQDGNDEECENDTNQAGEHSDHLVRAYLDLNSLYPQKIVVSGEGGGTKVEVDYYPSVPTVPYRGYMDELSIYGRVLAKEDVDALYRAAQNMLHLKLDEAPASTSFRNAASAGELSAGTVRRDVATCPGDDCPVSGLPGRSGRAVQFGWNHLEWRGSLPGVNQTLSFWFKDNFTFVTRQSESWVGTLKLDDNGNVCAYGREEESEATCTSNANYRDGKWHHVAQVLEPLAAPAQFAPNLDRITGRYVRIQLTGNDMLSLAEVEVQSLSGYNLAKDKPATQSSTDWRGEASRAVDGLVSGNFGDGSVTHTALEPHPWWEVDLGDWHYISKIKLYNRTDAASDRLKDFYIFVSQTPFLSTDPNVLKNTPGVWSYYHAGAFNGVAEEHNAYGGFSDQYVQIQLNAAEQLQLAEVEVYDHTGAGNLALNKEAWQSSVFQGRHAGLAVDGNADGNYAHGSVAVTNADPNAWWQVDLGDGYQLKHMRIWNRTDCCGDRLRNFDVFVSASPIPAAAPNTLKAQGLRFSHWGGSLGSQAEIGLYGHLKYMAQGRDFNVSGFKVAASAKQALYVDGYSRARGNTVLLPASELRMGYGARLDDVRLTAKALSSDEVRAIMKSAPQTIFHLEEGAGSTSFADETGKTSLVCQGAATQCPGAGARGQVGRALQFDGVDDAILWDNYQYQNPNYRFSAWIKRDEINREQWVVTDAREGSFKYWIGFTKDNKFAVFSQDLFGWISIRATLQSYPDTNWNHWASIDGTIYRNGLPVESDFRGYSSWPAIPTQAGVWLGGEGDYRFKGRIDELVLYYDSYEPNAVDIREQYLAEQALVEERHAYNVTLDTESPTSALLLKNYAYYALQDTLLAASASDAASSVALLELGVTPYGRSQTWVAAPPCLDGDGQAAWCPTFSPSVEGTYHLQVRATDATGQRQNPTQSWRVYVDGTPPALDSSLVDGALLGVTPHPTQQGQMALTLFGVVSDPRLAGGDFGSGVSSVRVVLLDAAGQPVGLGQQAATVSGGDWTVDYAFLGQAPSGRYRVVITAEDKVGNTATLERAIDLDTTGPAASQDAAALSPGEASIVSGEGLLQGALDPAANPVGAALWLPFEEAAGAATFGPNYALQRPVSQSSTQDGHPAANAVDGDPTSAARTNSEPRAWWQVDLGQSRLLDEVWIDAGTALNDLRLYLSETPFGSTDPAETEATGIWRATVASLPAGGYSLGRAAFTHPSLGAGDPLRGRYLRLQLGGMGVLDLNEVQVYGLRGTCAGAACPAAGETGVHGRAIHLDGNDSIQVPNRAGLNPARLTVGLWARSDSAAWPDLGFLVAKPGAYALGTVRDTKNLLFSLNTGSWVFFEFAAPDDFDLTAWHHYAGTYDGATVRIYVDGVLRSSTPHSGSLNTADPTDLFIGRDVGPGHLDEFSLYDRALSAGEIERLARRQVADVASVEVAFTPADPGSPFYNESPPLGQVLHLPLDDAPRQDGQLVIKDISGGGHDGTCSNCPATGQPGMRGQAMDWDGQDDSIRVPNHPSLNPAQITLSAWARSAAPSWNGSDLLLKANAYKLSTVANTKNLRFSSYTAGSWQSAEFAAPNDFDFAAWHYYVGTYDGITIKLYVDGEMKGSRSHSGSLNTADTRDLLIGRDDDSSCLRGQLDDVRILDRALDPAEIRQLYLGSEPVLWLPFDEPFAAQGTQLADASAWGHRATLRTDYRDTTNKAVAGQVGPFALNRVPFADNDTRIQVPNHPSLNPDQITVSVWAKGHNMVSDIGTLVYKQGAYTLGFVGNKPDLRFYYGSTDGAYVQSVVFASPGWHHYAGTYDGTTLKIYVDGKLNNSAQVGSLQISDRSRELVIGGNNQPNSPLDDVRIYPRALSKAELESLAQSGWHTTVLTSTPAGHSNWSLPLPVGLEGSYRLDLRATDALGNRAIAYGAWQGGLDTTPPRLSLASQQVSGKIYEVTQTSDYNLAETGFSSPCGAGAIDSHEYYQSAWYKALAEKTTRLVGLNVECPGFGLDRKVLTNFGDRRDDRGQALVLQPDGKFVIAGQTDLYNSSSGRRYSDFALARYNPDGSLDPSFDRDGKVITSFKESWRSFDSNGKAMVLQPDEKIVVAGSGEQDGVGYFVLARYNPDGSLDPSFNFDGKVTTSFPGWAQGHALILQPDGKLVVAGYVAMTNYDFALARYNPDGSLDGSFDGDGRVTTDLGGSDFGNALVLQPDGKLVVAGSSNSDFALARYNPNGSLDSSFGTGGKVTTDLGGNDYGNALVLQPDGKLVVAGTSNENLALARYNADGSLDTSFDGDGKVTTDLGGRDYGDALVLQPDGKLVVAGSSNSDFALARYNPDGSLDSSFDGDGKASIDFGERSFASALVRQPDGMLLVAGTAEVGHVFHFALVRFTGGSDPQSTACDSVGNCATVSIATGQRAELAGNLPVMAQTQAAPPLDILLGNVPHVVTHTLPLTLTGNAYAYNFLRAITLTMDSVPFYTQAWASSAVTNTQITATLSLTGEGPHSLELAASDWATNTIHYTWTHPIILDTEPPQVGLTTRAFTATHLSSEGMLVPSGPVTDTGGISEIAVTVGGSALRVEPAGPYTGEPLLAGAAEWRAFWPQDANDLPDGLTLPITVTVSDVAYRTVTETATLTADLVAPTALTPTVSAGGLPITPGLTVSDTNNLLLTWTPGSDGSGLGGYRAGWRVEITDTATSSLDAFAPGDTRQAALTAPEGSKVTALLQASDTLGNVASLEHGPLYVDGPLTPDYVHFAAGENLYSGWLGSGCTILGSDARIRDKAIDGAALDDAQSLYLTWRTGLGGDDDALRLAWTGADWDSDGDLFVYLDTGYGGSRRAFNPYTDTTTLVFLPPSGGHGTPAGTAGTLNADASTDAAGSISRERWAILRQAQDEPSELAAGVTNQSAAFGAAAFGADYVIWVQDRDTATLLAWDDYAGAWQPVAADLGYRFAALPDEPDQTHLLLPLSALGVADPANTSLSLLAFASEDGSLRLWATQPADNPANSPRLLDTVLPDDVQLFMLTQAFAWPSLGSGLCPNGTVQVSAQAPAVPYSGADVDILLAAEPEGLTYRFLGDQLFDLMPSLPTFAGSVDWDAALAELCSLHPEAPSCQGRSGDRTGLLLEGISGIPKAEAEPVIPTLANAPVPRKGASPQAAATGGATWDPGHGLRGRLGTEVPAVGDGQAVTYTFSLRNRGEDQARGLVLDALTFGPLRLPEGTPHSDPYGEYYSLVKNLGDLAPGEALTVTVAGLIDYAFDAGNLPLGLANLDLVIYDSRGSVFSNQLEWAFVTYDLDQSPPLTVLRPNSLLIAPGANGMGGLVLDQSAVPEIALEIVGPAGSQTIACPAAEAGRWACPWDAGAANEGDTFRLRARANDVYGQTGDWTGWLQLTVDDAPPGLTFDLASTAALSDTLLGPGEATLGGGLADNRLVNSVDACAVVDGEERCQEQAVGAHLDTLPLSQFIYEDAPAEPLPLGAGQGCYSGQEVHRFITVPDAFTVADVQVGLNVAHPYRYDVSAWLQAPSGAWTPLLWEATPGSADYDVLLDDGAATLAADDYADHDTGSPLYDHVLRPAGALGVFRGEAAQGDWLLILCDYWPVADDGAYNQARLILSADVLPENTAGDWSFTVPMEEGLDYVGPRTYRFYGLDSVGNRQSNPLETSFYVDNVAPVITATQLVSSIVLAPATPLTHTVLRGLVADGGQVVATYVTLRSPYDQVQVEGVTWHGAEWSYDLESVMYGQYTLYVNAQDAAGNLGQAGPFLVTVGLPYKVYLPVVARGYEFTPLPDRYQLYLPLVTKAASGSAVPPAGVALSGPEMGLVGAVQTFTATVDPPATTVPITYTWQASGQAPVVHSGGLTGVVTFTWALTGTQALTVTAANATGSVSGTHRITVEAVVADIVPPAGVALSGPSEGLAGASHTFTATVGPLTTTLPITYTWLAAGHPPVVHSSGGLADVMTYTWSLTGTQAITVTAANAAGSVTGTHTITVETDAGAVPPANVGLAGPEVGLLGAAHTFTATVGPLTTTLPITYTWQAVGQPPVVHSGVGLADVVTFTWPLTGTQAITVTAANAAGSVSSSRTITIGEESLLILPASVAIYGPSEGLANVTHTFTATISPLTTTLPITYTWQATGQAPLVHGGEGLADVATFTWAMSGTQALTVTISNAAGVVSDSHVLTITVTAVEVPVKPKP